MNGKDPHYDNLGFVGISFFFLLLLNNSKIVSHQKTLKKNNQGDVFRFLSFEFVKCIKTRRVRPH